VNDKQDIVNTINALADRAYNNSKKHEFWDPNIPQAAIDEIINVVDNFKDPEQNVNTAKCEELIRQILIEHKVSAVPNIGEKIALMHSELSEGLEAVRKPKQDDHLPQYEMLDAEMADTMIRVLDFVGRRKEEKEAKGESYNFGEILLDKMTYNEGRPPKHGKAF